MNSFHFHIRLLALCSILCENCHFCLCDNSFLQSFICGPSIAFVIDIWIECKSQIEILNYKFGPAEEFCNAYLTNFEKWNAPKMSKQKRQTIDNLRKSSVPEAELPVAQEAKNPFVCYLKLTLYLANMSPPPKIQAKRKVTPHLKKWEHRGGGEKWVSRVSSIQGWHKETTLKAGKIYWSWSFTKSLLASSIFNRLFKGQFSSLGENETDFSVTKENPEDPFS